MQGRRRGIEFVIAAAVLIAVSVFSAPAHATGPITLEGENIVDRVEVLGDRRDELQNAIDRIDVEQNIGIYVVFIDTFGDRGPDTWAHTTARRSDLGSRDLLLVIATEDHRYTWSVEKSFPLSDKQLEEVAKKAVEPELARDRWAQAALGAANGCEAAAAGETIPSAKPDARTTYRIIALASALAVVIAGTVGIYRWKTRRGEK